MVENASAEGRAAEVRRVIEVVAHRGAGRDFGEPVREQAHRPAAPPENTLPAVEWGWREAAACEIDVRRTGDGRVVAIHDETTVRTCDRDLAVESTDLATLRTLDAGAKKGALWRGVRVPALAEVLAAMPAGRRLWLDVKTGPEIVPPLVADLEAAGRGGDQVVVISYCLETLRETKARRPDLGCYWIVRFREEGDRWTVAWAESAGDGVALRRVVRPRPDWGELIERCRRVDGFDVSRRQPPQFAAEMERAGIAWGAWTVDVADEAVELARRGAFQLTSNCPADVAAALSRAGFETAGPV